jgi:hypothetical protein
LWAGDVSATLDLALQANGLDQVNPTERPRLLSDNVSSYIVGDPSRNGSTRTIKRKRCDDRTF